jgi:hypothetical protein
MSAFAPALSRPIISPKPWETSTRSTSTSHVPTIAETEAVQHAFSKALLSATEPCAVKGKNYSDVERCSLFGIGLGMSLEDVKQKIISSSFFTREPMLIKGCHGSNKQCIGYVFEHKDGFSVSVEFEPTSDEATKASALVVSDVTLWFTPGANPYFDPESMRSIFVKLIGEPDISRDIGDRWGDVEFSGGIPTVWDAAIGQSFAVVLSSGHPSETFIASNDGRLFHEAQR